MNPEAQQKFDAIMAKNPQYLTTEEQNFLIARKAYVPMRLRSRYPFLNPQPVKPVEKPVVKQVVRRRAKRK